MTEGASKIDILNNLSENVSEKMLMYLHTILNTEQTNGLDDLTSVVHDIMLLPNDDPKLTTIDLFLSNSETSVIKMLFTVFDSFTPTQRQICYGIVVDPTGEHTTINGIDCDILSCVFNGNPTEQQITVLVNIICKFSFKNKQKDVKIEKVESTKSNIEHYYNEIEATCRKYLTKVIGLNYIHKSTQFVWEKSINNNNKLNSMWGVMSEDIDYADRNTEHIWYTTATKPYEEKIDEIRSKYEKLGVDINKKREF